MLSALKNKAEFDRVLKSPTFYCRYNWLTLFARPNNLGTPRLGTIISRRNSRSSVLRNAIKRRLREYLRTSELGYDIVLFAQSVIPRDKGLPASRQRERACLHTCYSIQKFTKKLTENQPVNQK